MEKRGGPVLDKHPSFTEEQINLFESRLANGYDLFMDSDYVTWLQQNHPHSLPDQLRVGATVNLHSTPIRSTEYLPSSSSLPLTPIVINSSDPLEGPSCNHSDSFTSGDSLTTSFRNTREVFSAVSQFLSIPPSSITKHPNNKGKGKEKAGSGARVLTSEESLAMVEEKERQKKRKKKLSKEESLREKKSDKRKTKKDKELKAVERQRKAEERKQVQN